MKAVYTQVKEQVELNSKITSLTVTTKYMVVEIENGLHFIFFSRRLAFASAASRHTGYNQEEIKPVSQRKIIEVKESQTQKITNSRFSGKNL